MVANILQHRLAPLIRAEQQLRRNRLTSFFMAMACLAGLTLLALEHFAGIGNPTWVFLWIGLSVVALLILWRWLDSRPVDLKEIAARLEEKFPDLDHRLLTALDVRSEEPGKLGYLQERVVSEAIDHSVEHVWQKHYRPARRFWGHVLHGMSMIALLGVTFSLLSLGRSISEQKAELAAVEEPAVLDFSVEVSPGDTEVERSSRLIVEAKFAGGIPETAHVELLDPETGEVLESHSMRQNLEDPIFGTVIPGIDQPTDYRVTWLDGQSERHSISVYVHPDLERADVTITPPEYAGKKEQTIRDVRKLTALEGSDLDFRFELNKPVAAAELFGEDESVIPLVPDAEDPTVLVAQFRPGKQQKYRLHLVDEADRANKQPPWFTINLKRNEPPRLELTFPGQDSEVSALEEMALQGNVWDDLGVARVGASFTVGEQTEELILQGEELPGEKKHDFGTVVALEKYKAEPTQLVSYHFWAEDTGPDGKLRRTESDMYFAEVRHWEHIFRQGAAPPPGQGGPQNQSAELMKQQKEVMNATWKLIRKASLSGIAGELEDVAVVRDSQQILSGMVEEAMAKAPDAKLKELLEEAKGHMDAAVGYLSWVADNSDGDRMEDALDAEKKAYQSLLQAAGRETEVTQSQSSSSSGSRSESQQKQLMELELKGNADRYETESQAQSEQAATQQEENLAVLTRLKELARREAALAEKLKELEAALKAAETEEEQEELERQLKRLQEEQEQMLRDVDDLMERMESPQNQERMAEERQQLAETREQVQKTNEQLQNEQLSEAANSATRAERELSQIEEEFRERTSSRFADEMRDMRQQARELTERQEEIAEQFEKAPNARNPFEAANSEFNNFDVSRDLAAQKERLESLLKQMQRVSEQADGSEPVLSDELHDTVREARMAGAEEALGEASSMTRYGQLTRAQEPEREAARAMEALKEGVEKAAESVLGSEADALRMARNELDQVIESIQQERDRQAGTRGDPTQQGEGRQPGEEQEDQAGQGAGQMAENTEGQQPGEEQEGPRGQGEGQMAENAEGQQPGEGQEGQAGQGEGQMAENAEGQQSGEGQEGQRGQGAGQMAENSEGQQAGEGQEGQRGQGEGQMAENAEGQQPGEGQEGQPGQGEGQMAENAEGQQSGEGQEGQRGQGEGQMAENSEGQQPGQGQQGEGQLAENAADQQSGQGENPQPGQGQQSGQGEGQMGQGGQGQSEQSQPGDPSSSQPSSSGGSLAAGGGAEGGGANRYGGDPQREAPLGAGGSQSAGSPGLFFEQIEDVSDPGPIMGEDYEEWADSLRTIEEVLETPELRSEAARVMDRARSMRIDYRRNDTPPQWDLVQETVIDPLVQLRDRVSEELARQDQDNPLVPIDRDPVPGEYRELVRKYYEKLATGE